MSFEDDPLWKERLTLDDRPGPALRLPRSQTEAMIADAISSFYAEASTRVEAPVPEPGEAAGEGAAAVVGSVVSILPAPDRRPRRGLRVLLVAATLLCAIGLATAATLTWQRWRVAPGTPEVADGAGPRQTGVAPAAAPEPAEEAPAPDLEPGAPAEPAETEPAQAEPSVTAPEPPAVAPAPGGAAPADLLKRANLLRGARKWRAAEQAYLQVTARFPHTDSAYVAAIAAAQIQSEHLADPANARRLFQRALADMPDGALDEEARLGLAEACGKLGRRAEERRALEALLRLHPHSPFEQRARARLGALSRD